MWGGCLDAPIMPRVPTPRGCVANNIVDPIKISMQENTKE